MPDVVRSHSVRSADDRPRVSFNRDVHVKRIGPRETPRTIPALSGVFPNLTPANPSSVASNPSTGSVDNGTLSGTRLVTTPVRRERLGHLSRRELAEEAAKVLQQADSVACVSQQGALPNKFYTLPVRRKRHKAVTDSPNSSTERTPTNGATLRRRKSEELGVTVDYPTGTPPKKPPRTFLSRSVSDASSSTPKRPQRHNKNALINLFKKIETYDDEVDNKKSTNLSRSNSDVTDSRSNKNYRKRNGFENDDGFGTFGRSKKTQLSPIIEISPKEDLSDKPEWPSVANGSSDKENKINNQKTKVTDIKVQAPERKKNKKQKPELSQQANKENRKLKKQQAVVEETAETKTNKTKRNKPVPEIVIIDVDEAEDISTKNSKNFFKDGRLSTTLKSLTKRKNNKDENNTKNQKKETKNDKVISKEKLDSKQDKDKTNRVIKEEAEEDMIRVHSSQKPVAKLPLTKGNKVDFMVKRLSHGKFSPPPKTNTALKTPTPNMQHNNNKPFSYTQPRPTSPDYPVRPTSPYTSPGYRSPYNDEEDKTYPPLGSSPTRYYNRSPDRNDPGQIIYAQVVCGSKDNNNKQTIHTAYTNGGFTNKKGFINSDSDEGLGNDEIPRTNSFGAKKVTGDDPIMPKVKSRDAAFESSKLISQSYKKESYNSYIDSARGRADGMDSKRRESLTENINSENVSPKYNNEDFITPTKLSNGRSDLSYRRDLLESRINSRNRMFQTSPEFSTPSPNVHRYVSESSSKYYRNGDSSPVGYTEKYTSETRADKNGELITSENRVKERFGNDRNVEMIRERNYENEVNNGVHERNFERKQFLESQLEYDSRINNYIDDNGEPKSFDSQVSDYRSSPENGLRGKRYEAYNAQTYKSNHSTKYLSQNEKLLRSKDQEHHKSNPEIIQSQSNSYDDEADHNMQYPSSQTYHDSLKRQKHERVERKFYETNISERRDKMVDSGIENDFSKRIDIPKSTPYRGGNRKDFCNDSEEDEGFASSLLIASERQHTDEYMNETLKGRNKNRDYDQNGDRDYRNIEKMDYKQNTLKNKRTEYAHRERSIDDGSHFDPRIDKDVFKGGKNEKNGGTLKRVDKKPPKSDKKIINLDKVKQLFTSKKSKEKKAAKAEMVREEEMRARYTEYKGSTEALNRKDSSGDNQEYDYSSRRRMATPSPSPSPSPPHRTNNREATLTRQSATKQHQEQTGWFKSLDRLANKKSKTKNEKSEPYTSNTEEESTIPPPPKPIKSLRFFGDTDIESNDSVRHKSSLKTRPPINNSGTLTRRDRGRSHSHRDLHNISESYEEHQKSVSDLDTRIRKDAMSNRSIQNLHNGRDEVDGRRDKSMSLKPPMSPIRRKTERDLSKPLKDEDKRKTGTLKRHEDSSTEDSQQSQRSVVYLHAATVGDIPGPSGRLSRSGRRAASREELNSISSSRIQPQAKTLSRSFSVLAPWRPRHYRDNYELDYSTKQNPTTARSTKSVVGSTKSRIDAKKNSENNTSLKAKSKENISTLGRSKSKSKENLSSNRIRSKENGSTSNLYKKKDNRIVNKDESNKKRIATKSMSMESLGSSKSQKRVHSRDGDNDRERREKVSRSISMPKNSEKSAGWFGRKTKKNESAQRL